MPHLLRCSTAPSAISFLADVEFIVGGDDVLDLGAVFRLLNPERIQKNSLARQGFAETLQLGEMAMRVRE